MLIDMKGTVLFEAISKKNKKDKEKNPTNIYEVII